MRRMKTEVARVCNVTRPLLTNLVACNVTRNEPSVGVFPDQALVDNACNVTRGSTMLSVPADQLAVSLACNVTRHLVYVSHFQPASAEVIYVSHVMAQTIPACNVTRGSTMLSVPADQLAVSLACNVTRHLVYVCHSSVAGRALTYVCHSSVAGRALTYVCHSSVAGRALTYVCHSSVAGRALTYVCHSSRRPPVRTYELSNELPTSLRQPVHAQSLTFKGAPTIRCVSTALPPGKRKKQTDRPHTRPPRNRGFLLGTRKSNFARLSQPGSDGRSAFGGWK